MTGAPRPPRLASALVRLIVPSSEAHGAAGDLDEEFARDVSPSRAAWRAHLWYWRESLSLVRAYCVERARHRRRRMAHVHEPTGQPKKGSLMDTVRQDLRQAWRLMTRNPGFACIAVLVLGLGIGAATAIGSAVDAVLLRPLPYVDASTLVIPKTVNIETGQETSGISFPQFLDWKRETEIFEQVALFRRIDLDISGGSEPERIHALQVTEAFFPALRSSASTGRLLGVADFAPGAPRVVVLSHELWRRRFGGDRAAVGADVRVAGVPFLVVGVLAADAQFPPDCDAWAPLPFAARPPEWAMRYDNMIFSSVARLRRGVALTQARTRMRDIALRVAAERPESMAKNSATVVRMRDWIVGPQLTRTLQMLAAAVAFVLLIACANVANLLIVRSTVRQRELAVRAAVGASRARLVRQLLTETALLATAGGALGLGLGIAGIRLLVRLAPADIPRLDVMQVDQRVLAIAALSTLATALICGLLPAWPSARGTLGSTLKEGGRSSTEGPGGRRLRSLLVVGEVALSMILLAGAGLMVRSFIRLQQVDPGIRADHLLTLRLTLPQRYNQASRIAEFFEQALSRVRSLPGVASASAVSALPVGGGGFYLGRAFLIEGQPEPPASTDYGAQWNTLTPGTFATFGMRLLQGRDFSAADDNDKPLVMIINRTMATRLFPKGDAIGKRIRSWRDENKYREVVGIVDDVRYFDRGDELRGIVYVPHRQDSWSAMSLVIRTQVEPAGLTRAVKAEIAALDPALAVADVRTMDDIVFASVAPARFSAMLLGIFAVTAMILAAVGLYGLLAQHVVQRTHEIGVRMALGARVWDVILLVVRQAVTLAAVGIVFGVAGAVALARALRTLLFEVTAGDVPTYVAVTALFAAVTLVACVAPARRAARLDPVVALRDS